MSSGPDAARPMTLGRRIARHLLTVLLALATLGVAAALTWASLAPPRQSGIPEEPGRPGGINDLPADLTWLLLIGIAVVAWRQVAIGTLTAIGCAALVMEIATVEASRYAAAGENGRTQLLIFVIAIVQTGAFIVVGVATGIFGWHQRRLRRTLPA